MTAPRLATGVEGLDDLLGGGLIGGTLCVVVGASGIGKTQLGLQFLHAGTRQEGRPGIVFDMSARIDSQSHCDYARRMFDWTLGEHPREQFDPASCFAAERAVGQYLHVFDQQGRRVSKRDLDFDGWHDWQAELAGKLELSIDFFYSNLTRGAKRAVIDGIEPAERPSESVQFELAEYVYHQILRKESDWVARDLFRQHFREHEAEIAQHTYDHRQVAAMLLSTSHETMLEALIERPLVDGDMLASANTLIYMGKIRDREEQKLARGLFIAKHRGSACSDEIIRYTIDERGIQLA